MLLKSRATLVAAWVLVACGCTAQGTWMGAENEKAYDKELEAKRLAETLNNDDYYQIHQDNRIYVLSDGKDFANFVKIGEVAKSVTKIGGGPAGERLIFGVTGTESKAMEKVVGYKSSAEEMYSGNRKGLAKGFLGVLLKDGRYVVTDDWAVAEHFRKGSAPAGGTAGTAPDGKPVTYLVKGDAGEVRARFEKLLK